MLTCQYCTALQHTLGTRNIYLHADDQQHSVYTDYSGFNNQMIAAQFILVKSTAKQNEQAQGLFRCRQIELSFAAVTAICEYTPHAAAKQPTHSAAQFIFVRSHRKTK